MLAALIGQSRVIIATLVMLFVAGVYAYVAIPKESNPDIPIPTMYVSVSYQGIAPEDAVNQLLKPLEKELRSLAGLKDMEGTAYEGGANLVITFQAGFDPKTALADVRSKVDIAKAELPEAADEPVVTEINLSLFPIVSVVLSGNLPERALKKAAEDLQDRIEGLPGVLEAPVAGLREEILLVEIDRAKLETHALSLSDVLSAVRANNALITAGSLELAHGKYAIKVPGLFRSPLDLMNLPLIANGPRVIRVKDVGDVKLAFRDAEGFTRINGQPALTLGVKKRIGANIIATVDAVRQAVKDESASWPAGLTAQLVNDESQNIRTMLADLENSVLVSTALVLVVVLLALGWRGAFLVAMTVPGSFLAAIFLLYVLGFTTNVVVLFTLILSVGILVDGAIVVAEMADRNMAEGMPRSKAYVQAAQYMAMPVLASTLTILAAFLPLFFWPDIVGEFMRFMPITLFFTLIASWVMAMIYLPALGQMLPTPPRPQVVAPDAYEGMAKRYVDMLHNLLLPKAGMVVAGAVASLVLVLVVFGIFNHGVQFFPNIEPDRVNVVVHAKGDLSLADKDALVRQVEALVAQGKGIRTIITQVGAGGAREQPKGDTIGTLTLELEEWDTGRPTANAILAEALRATQSIPGIWVEQQQERAGPQQGKPIRLAIRGPDMTLLRPVALSLKEQLGRIQGVTDITDNLPEAGIEWVLRVDREKALQQGTNLAMLGQTIQLATNGAIVGTYRPNDRKEELDIVARLTADARNLSTLDTLAINTPTGRVPVGDISERVAVPKVDIIYRLNQKTAVTVEADVAPGTLPSDVVAMIEQGLKTASLPVGVDIQFKGDQDQQDDTSAFLQLAFIGAVSMIGLIMLVAFNSFYQCFVVLSAVVFSTMGVFMGHLITGKPFGIVMSGLGIIALAGIIVSNNIVLIDTYNKLKQSMPSWQEALLQTCKLRLRPVLLTQITTVVGLLPLALKLTIDITGRSISYNAPSSQWWDQLAVAIIFGATFGTILTLVVTPCMLALRDRRRL